MNNYLIASVALAFLLTGCDVFKQKTAAPETPPATDPVAQEAAAPVGEAPKPAETTCKDGQKPQVLTGACTGTWTYVKTDNGATCNFNWGPMVKCPDGQVSLGHEAECYGTTGKPVQAADKISTDMDCATKFGKRPVEITYTMQCCPK